ncbi:MAG: ArdC-like ssDNA-binding domain-containing protein [Actinomycetota bacterium]|nr:ArdC-like ssDNA-binding domain-containing protein [Actinomycetota bacterium]
MTAPSTVGARQARASRTPEQRQADLEATLATLQAGVASLQTSDGWRAWLDFAARMPAYSLNNQLLIVAQRPTASAVASYTAWKSLGRQVRRGGTGIRILAPTTRRITRDGGADADDNAAPEPDDADVREQSRRVLTGFRTVAVFDVAQTDGDPLPVPQRPALLQGQAPEGLWGALAHQVAAANFTLTRVADAAMIGGANGVTDFGARTVRVRMDVSEAQAVKTLAHELGHVMLHDPASDPTWSMPCREVKEVEAESVAYVVTAHAGLDSSEYTFGYVAGWSAGTSPEVITKVAGRVLATARSITERLDLPAAAELVDHAVSGTRLDMQVRDRLKPAQLSPAGAGTHSLTQ